MNLTQRREGAKGAKIRLLRCCPCIAPSFPVLRCHSRFFTPSFPRKRESRRLGTAFAYHPLPLNFGFLQPRELMSTRPRYAPPLPIFALPLPTSPSSFPRKRESSGLRPKPRLCQNQDWRDFQDFAFAQPAPFAITENPANPNTNKRLPNPENPIIP